MNRGSITARAGRVWLGLALATLVLFSASAPAAPPVRIAYVDWSSSVASANVVCAVLRERLEQDCALIETTADEMWRLVADGEADVMLSAWLPETHAAYHAEYGQRLRDLGPNLEGTRTGLVIPAVSVGRQTGARGARNRPVLDIESIRELAEHRDALSGRIVGIDPEAGIMAAAERAIDAYGLDGFRLLDGSETEMSDALADAIAHNRPIVITGWVPHWMFGRWSLRFLADPKGVFGGRGAIHTMVRPGFRDDNPEAARLLDAFSWDPREMERLLVWVHQDNARDPYAQALRWLRVHPQRVDAWLTAAGAG